jgi:hypothetical protein
MSGQQTVTPFCIARTPTVVNHHPPMSAPVSTNRVPPEIATVLVGLAVKVPANREPSDTDTEKVATVVPAGELSGLRRCRVDGNATPGRRRRQSWHLPAGLSTLRVGPQFVKCARCVCDAEPGVGPFIAARRVGGCDRDALVSARDWTLRCGVIADWDPRPALAQLTKLLTYSRKNCIDYDPSRWRVQGGSGAVRVDYRRTRLYR